MEATFDSLGYFEKLKDAGLDEKIAKVQANALREIIDGTLATKRDLKELEAATRRDLKELEARLEYKLTLKLGSIVVACTALLSILPYLTK